MARLPHKRGRGASDLGGALTGLLRSTLAQAGAVRDVIERGARSGRARLDEVLDDTMGDRRRVAALAELGEIILTLVRDGEIDLEELPEIAEVVERLERLDERSGDGPRRTRRPLGASRESEASASGRRGGGAGRGIGSDDDLTGDFRTENVPPLAARFYDRYSEEPTEVGGRQRKTEPLPRRRITEPMTVQRERQRRPSASGMAPLSRPAQDDLDEDELVDDELEPSVDQIDDSDERASLEQLVQARRAVTQPMRVARPIAYDDDSGELPELGLGHSRDELDEPWSKRVALARGAVDGTVSSTGWQPPPPRHAEARVWRPGASDATRIPVPFGDDDEDDKTNDSRPVTARMRPMDSQPISSRRTPPKGTEAPHASAEPLPDAPALADASSPAIAPTLAPSLAPALARSLAPVTPVTPVTPVAPVAPAIAPTLSPAPRAEERTQAGSAPSPAGIHMPLAELRTVEDAAPTAPAVRDPLIALAERSPFGTNRGGISFDDDLEEYMHPDDVPARDG